MSECIEVEYSSEYNRGYADGIESFRPKFKQFMARVNEKSCDGCVHWYPEYKGHEPSCHQGFYGSTCSRNFDDKYEPKDK